MTYKKDMSFKASQEAIQGLLIIDGQGYRDVSEEASAAFYSPGNTILEVGVSRPLSKKERRALRKAAKKGAGQPQAWVSLRSKKNGHKNNYYLDGKDSS